jgi:hypothetical protein
LLRRQASFVTTAVRRTRSGWRNPGWPNADDQVALVRDTDGQDGHGFYSSDIPNGSGLCDKTSEETFVTGGRVDPALFTK